MRGTWAGAAGAIALVAGCGVTGEIGVYTCERPCNGVSYACEHPCDCPGACVPTTPAGWSGPVLVWLGPDGRAPPCPAAAPLVAYDGYNGLEAQPEDCPTCECEPAPCEPPALIANAASCPGTAPSTTHAPLDVPAGWDGSCAAVSSEGARSITLAPPEVGPCEPITTGADAEVRSLVGPTWRQHARVCAAAAPDGSCDDERRVCVPSAPREQGWRQCVLTLAGDDHLCPSGYPERHVLYDGAEDGRSCTPCSCGEPRGGLCAAVVEWYRDEACQAFVLGNSVAAVPACTDSVAWELRSVAATLETIQAGTCEPSGGELVGDVRPVGASTFCCAR